MNIKGIEVKEGDVVYIKTDRNEFVGFITATLQTQNRIFINTKKDAFFLDKRIKLKNIIEIKLLGVNDENKSIPMQNLP
jgi:hypothetical protein